MNGESIRIAPLVGLADDLPGRLAELESLGITEVALQPMGDIARDLRAFAAASGVGG